MRTCYLAGPMEYAVNAGLNWRLEAREKLQKLNVKCIIPNEEEQDLVPVNFVDLKKTNLHEYVRITRTLIERDLAFVESVDFIVVFWNGERMAGTIHEVGYAYQLNKPVYLITPQELSDVPGWFLSCCTACFRDINNFALWYGKKIKE